MPTRARRCRDEGFSLVELAVVVVILGVLVAIALPSFLGSRTSAQDRAAQSQIRAVLLAAKAFRLEHGAYTVAIADLLAFDPNVAVHAADSTIGVEPWFAQGTDQTVCLTRTSKSGNLFSVWESVTVGTWYGTADLSGGGANCPAAVPAGYTQDGW